jgi:hypothetical protein
VNRWRTRHKDFGKAVKKAPTTFGELTDDSDDAKAAEDIFSVAASHRSTVIEKDKIAAARRKAGRRGR